MSEILYLHLLQALWLWLSVLCLCPPVLFLLFFFCIFSAIYCRLFLRYHLQPGLLPRPSFAFYHPNLSDGGGGERVLWTLISSLADANIVIYSKSRPRKIQTKSTSLGSSTTSVPLWHYILPYPYRRTYAQVRDDKELVTHVSRAFGIDVSDSTALLVEVKTHWMAFAQYRFCTLLVQGLVSLLVAMECLWRWTPDVWIDTSGAAFMCVVAKWIGGCSTAAYVHYPTISVDMLDSVKSCRGGGSLVNNSEWISSSKFLTCTKIWYYRLFAFLYGMAGKCVDVVMCNSSWTRDHINYMWSPVPPPSIIYPPCDFRLVGNSPVVRKTKALQIVSVGQFRPEKDHRRQLVIFSKLFSRLKPTDDPPSLHIVGSTRGAADMKLVHELRSISSAAVPGRGEKRCWGEYVTYHVNSESSEVFDQLCKSRAFLHTMQYEHFGISVIEAMEAGAVVVAHNSGGVKADIVKTAEFGILCESDEEFVEGLYRALYGYNTDPAIENMVDKAFLSVKKTFLGNQRFTQQFRENVVDLFCKNLL
eukprot:GHVQ01038479.1.p1 GENE.GHVQ01038479.1~~GHVQ01038479.1.p1  ORF type:complete len:531 (-),score=65.61 GHVQ01038479.1:963-2555(-)